MIVSYRHNRKTGCLCQNSEENVPASVIMFGKAFVLLPLIVVVVKLSPSVASRVDGLGSNTDRRWTAVVRNHWICAGHNPPVYFPHDIDCARYYMCDCVDAYEYSCGAGMRFNPQALQCDLASRVQCPSGGPFEHESDIPVHPPNTVSPEPSEEPAIDPRCPPLEAGRHAVRYWAHGSNCAIYYRCSHGQVKELHCPEGSVWDNAVKGCGPPNPNKCCSAVPPAPVLNEQHLR